MLALAFLAQNVGVVRLMFDIIFFPMRIISWDIQCLKKSQVSQEIKILIWNYNPNLLFLLENMVNEKNTLRILQTLGFDHFDYVLPSNHSGGLGVLWSNGAIHASILFNEPCNTYVNPWYFYCTIVSEIYAPAQPHHKANFGCTWLSLALLLTPHGAYLETLMN